MRKIFSSSSCDTSSFSSPSSTSSCSSLSSSSSFTSARKYPVRNPLLEGHLSECDEKLVRVCVQVHRRTFISRLGETSISMPFRLANCDWKSADEFTQEAIRRCVQFCMQIPGNSDLETDDRAKLLKYGAYEVYLLRLASLYNRTNDCIELSNGARLCEADMKAHAFGCYGHTFFQFCRHMSNMRMSEEELSLVEAMLYFTIDRPMLQERLKVERLQTKFSETLRLLCAKKRPAEPMYFSRLLLTLMKLRALDALSKPFYLYTMKLIFF